MASCRGCVFVCGYRLHSHRCGLSVAQVDGNHEYVSFRRIESTDSGGFIYRRVIFDQVGDAPGKLSIPDAYIVFDVGKG